jgi:hypothetical protein
MASPERRGGAAEAIERPGDRGWCRGKERLRTFATERELGFAHREAV